MQPGSHLVVNTDANYRKFLGASFSLLQKCSSLNKLVQFHVIFTKFLLILLHGLECFKLYNWQKQKLSVSFNTIIRRIFNLSRMSSIRNLWFYMGIKPIKTLFDEKKSLLVLSCLHKNCMYVTKKMSPVSQF